MRRLWISLLLFAVVAVSAMPAFAQDFGLEEGDDVNLAVPKADPEIGKKAEPAAAPARSGELVLAAPSRVELGMPFLVRLTSDLPLDDVSVHWGGKAVQPSISVWNSRHVALVMLGTDVISAKPGKQELVVTAAIDGKENTFRRNVVVRGKKYPRQDLTLPEKMVTPPEEVLKRIADERVVIAEARDTLTPLRHWALPLERPVSGRITSAYGLQRFLNGKPRNPHRGIDFRSPMGNPVKSVADGEVVLVGDHYYAGKSVYVDHGNGVVSMYFHLSKPIVKAGDKVRRGQAVGLSGMTGRATGPHLHFSLAVQGRLVDPMPLFQAGADELLN
ncbi:M23 family metallopeptidase [Pseudodesulfovibrio tunisiensis]|uniref:M23 family metallopeptidase n=1 Tax=Pseudodesulfovibrio tunisiensis TaxID=463192 RepID=UPI001FB3538A|nr:M23 family metallopeptidase [Pseudodesulfovibrio tunisiensis]